MRATIDLQAICTANLPRGLFVDHIPACVVQKTRHHAISIAPVLVGKLDYVVHQTSLISTALGKLALRGSMLTECAAGLAFTDTKLPPHMVYAFAATRRA